MPERSTQMTDTGMEPKVLTLDDLKKLTENNHRCTEDSGCGCKCGMSYDKDWNGIISRFGRFPPTCKCKPAKTMNASRQEPSATDPIQRANWLMRLNPGSRVNIDKSHLEELIDLAVHAPDKCLRDIIPRWALDSAARQGDMALFFLDPTFRRSDNDDELAVVYARQAATAALFFLGRDAELDSQPEEGERNGAK